jgi:hypothetical protein
MTADLAQLVRLVVMLAVLGLGVLVSSAAFDRIRRSL